MDDDSTLILRDLLTDAEALQTSMLLTINGLTEDMQNGWHSRFLLKNTTT